MPRALRAGAAAGAILFVAYALTLAPDVTFWDAGEFVAAAVTFGVPHPPGTPLYVLLARATVLALGGVNPAVALGLLSAACTATACGVAGALVAEWTRRGAAGFAAALAAGTASSVWLSATEPEVYSAVLLLVALTLWSADRVGRREPGSTPLTAYALALAAPLHLSALVAAPAALFLAVDRWDPAARRRALLVGSAAAASAGVATASVLLLGLAAAALVAACVPGAAAVRARNAIGVALLCGLAFSALAVLLVRAQHDPVVNQGNPATPAALLDAVARRQYLHAGLWPRQAPLWMQLVNVLEYADWQFARAFAPAAPPTVARTMVTVVYAALAVVGSLAHRQADRRSWRALLVLLLSGTVGVVIYLNLKAGPSIGWGVLPDDAPHEARERDYFFALGFWTWGLWAGVGAVTLAARLRGLTRAGAVVAALPLAFNYAAVDRRQQPAAALPRRFATLLLESAPPRSVLLAAGDNDSYPLWYAQQALGLRRDVTVVTVPLLPAAWYRAELARRHALLAASDSGVVWRGERAVLGALGARARSAGRPVVATASLESQLRQWVHSAWTFDGVLYRAVSATGGRAPVTLDTAGARRHAAALAPWLAAPVHDHADAAAHYTHELLSCAGAVLRAGRDHAADSLLAGRCSGR